MTDFDELYARHFADIYRYVFSLCRNEAVAEDIVSETFLKAFKSIHRFQGECKLEVWLCQIAKNTYYTQYQKDKRLDPLDDAVGIEVKSFEAAFINRESAFEIHKALHDLSEPYKEVLSLRIFGELPFAQIARLFGKTESWARVTFHRGKSKIKEELQ
jgi:RNA polymerase sigma-70 factor (ECF subfamily)